MNLEELSIGQKVHYSHPITKEKQNGIIKDISNRGAFVVYNCDGDWDNYKDYTSELTAFQCLSAGWVGKMEEPNA